MDLAMQHAQWARLAVKKNLAGADAIKAVERNGDALQYVEERWFKM
jgi:hypothetical protein